MKKPWQTLAALVAFVAVAAVEAATEEHQLEPATDLRYYPCRRPGCYSSISGMIPEVEWPKATFQPRLPDWQEQPLLEVKPTEESFLSILHRLSTASRSKRNIRKAPPASRRRGKQREGARPVCRGCYSGLTIVAAPTQEGKKAPTQEGLWWSQSESGEDSSGGI
ncbi:hypothetical protein lerEdw1_006028 [Lerista edwardsae]|nr:hypothetical protein lerEdw1_006028 [Lerista edwardsae]